LYRLEKPEEINSVHFDEYFYGPGISIIEWPGRLGERAPRDYWLVKLTHKGEQKRGICISYPSNPRRKILP
jgi:tRNA threonylcarbamoyladenosine biosynthesis protein TsaE